jgi:hypothetical protein
LPRRPSFEQNYASFTFPVLLLCDAANVAVAARSKA